MSSTNLNLSMSLTNTKTLLVILGPTAIGKTALSIQLAQQLDTAIISCDSRQFFKEMCIGTAVPSKEELAAAPHHFIQHRSIHQTYSVGAFERDALKTINDLFKTKESLILVGGSGLYIDAVCQGLDHFPSIDESLRQSLRQAYADNGMEWLQKEVKELDPAYWEVVDQQNAHRLLRCLEVCKQSGKTFSSFRKATQSERSFNIRYIGLEMPREQLYQRINQRVDSMMEEGLLEEAKNLLPHQHLNALQTVGYRELFAHFNGEYELDRAVELIQQNTRRFAKRQLTWFKRYEKANWYSNAKEALLAEANRNN